MGGIILFKFKFCNHILDQSNLFMKNKLIPNIPRLGLVGDQKETIKKYCPKYTGKLYFRYMNY